MMCHGKKINIKKQIFFALGLFFSVSSLNAMCPETVGAVTPGEGIWRIASRIGEAMNVIQSQICSLDIVASSTVNNECTFTFGQDDIGTGNMFIITLPGTYCLRENVSIITGAAVTVNSSDVTIDLKGHTIQGDGVNLGRGVALGDGVENIIIQNGTIENMGAIGSTSGIGITNSLAVNDVANVIVRDINFNNNSSFAILFSNGTTNGLLIENCKAYESGGISVNNIITSALVRNCLLEERRGNSVAVGISLNGISSTNLASSLLIEDSISTGSTASFASSNPNKIEITNSENAIVRNCIGQEGFGQMFQFTNCRHMILSDCIARNMTSNGIQVNGSLADSSVLIERCAVVRAVGLPGIPATGISITSGTNELSSVKLIDCISSENSSNGFHIFAASPSSIDEVIVKGCSSSSNRGSGFLTHVSFLSYGASISPIIFEDCVAQGNDGDGFTLLVSNTASSIHDVVFRNCVAQDNQGGTVSGIGVMPGDGFGIGSSAQSVGELYNIVCQNCIAEDNVHNGFSFGATVTGSKILDCCAMNNTVTGIDNLPGEINAVLGNAAFNNAGGDISGVVDPSLLITRSIAGRLAGALRWVNAIS